MHSTQSFDHTRAVRAGDVLACTPRIVDIVDRGRMEILTYAIDCVDAGTRDHVLTSSTTLILFKSEEG